VWNFHWYNETDYSVGTIQDGIRTWINWITSTRNGLYAGTPIWLTEWGRLNGWVDPDIDLQKRILVLTYNAAHISGAGARA
jgi:hypothetical protein